MDEDTHIFPMHERAAFLSRHQLDIQSYLCIPFWCAVLFSPLFFAHALHEQVIYAVLAVVATFVADPTLGRWVRWRTGWTKPDHRRLRDAEPPDQRRARRWRMAGLFALYIVAVSLVTTFAPDRPHAYRLGWFERAAALNWGGVAVLQCLRVICDKSNPGRRRASYAAATSLLFASSCASEWLVHSSAFQAVSGALIMLAVSLSDLLLLLQLAPPREESEAA